MAGGLEQKKRVRIISLAAFFVYDDHSELTTSNRYEGADTTDTSAPVDPETRIYAYDNIGNRETAQEDTLTRTYTANNLNQYTEILSDGDSEMPAYDDDGNLTNYEDKKYTYNAENRLITVEPEGTPDIGDKKVECLYDYMGRRVVKTVSEWDGSEWPQDYEKHFIYDGWNLIEEITSENTVQTSEYYVWGLDLSQSLQGAGGIGGLIASLGGLGNVRYYLYDGNGNVGQVAEPDGTIAARYEYDPFGNAIVAEGDEADTNVFRFSTKFFDIETGLVYYGYRFYIPELGRWNRRDPLGERGGINLYEFVVNNPFKFYDPYGLNWKTRVKGGIRIVIGIIGGTASIVGMAGGGAAEGPTLGLSTGAIIGFGMLGTFSLDQIETGSRELWTGEDKIGITEAALSSWAKIDQEYDILGKMITIETGLGQHWMIPITQGLSASLGACEYYIITVSYKMYPRTRVITNVKLQEQIIYAVENVKGLSAEQAHFILEKAFKGKNQTSVVFGGSRVRGSYRLDSDLDIGYGNLTINQATKLNKKITKFGPLKAEEVQIVPGKSTDTIPEIKSPEEFFQRSGIRSRSDKFHPGEPFSASGSITLTPDEVVMIIPAGGKIP